MLVRSIHAVEILHRLRCDEMTGFDSGISVSILLNEEA
jgi:hypothetical protein